MRYWRKPRLKWSAHYQRWYTPSGAGPPSDEERYAWRFLMSLNLFNKGGVAMNKPDMSFIGESMQRGQEMVERDLSYWKQTPQPKNLRTGGGAG